jgi:xylan 1,4-beta-xylosidase
MYQDIDHCYAGTRTRDVGHCTGRSISLAYRIQGLGSIKYIMRGQSMQHISKASLIAGAAMISTAAFAAPIANFDYMSYNGHDPVEDAIPVKPGKYRNPVIPGFHPDPSIVRVGDDFYLINSTFAFYPGIPVFHSRDLVNWKQIGNAIDRPSQLDMRGIGINRGVFAPTIRYHRGNYYIINTCIDCKFNFIVTAKNPAGPWSDPVWLSEVDGIDPDIFFDDNGRVWISNNGPPIGEPQYDGHRAIWIQEYDLKAQKMIGPRSVIVNGGVDFAKKPIWTEGPHIFKKEGYYYLIAAEGGTSSDHSETIYRSKSVTGPYVPGPNNPILTQRDLDPKRPFPVYATGHADFVQLKDGSWWSVFLGTRPYEGPLTNLGRETFLLPVTWKGGWPTILAKDTPVPQAAKRPNLASPKLQTNWTYWNNSFDRTLGPEWLTLRTPGSEWRQISGGRLLLTAQADTVSGSGNPAFIGQRQRHGYANIETQVSFTPERTGDRAGLLALSNEEHHYFIGVCQSNSGPLLVVSKRDGKGDPENGVTIASVPYVGKPGMPVRFKLQARGAAYDFAYSIGRGKWQMLLKDADGRILATEYGGLSFTGTVIGAYAVRTDDCG